VEVLTRSGGSGLRIARSEKEGQDLWDIRKNLVLSLVGLYPDCEVISTDVCVPISRLAGLMEGYLGDQERINGGIQGVGLRSLVMGHVGDGNFHSLMYDP
jgi:D-lactate dehydrogenase (cytochrome)